MFFQLPVTCFRFTHMERSLLYIINDIEKAEDCVMNNEAVKKVDIKESYVKRSLIGAMKQQNFVATKFI